MDDMLDFERFEAVSFDCYGTLIDWEAGIVAAIRPVLEARGLDLSDAQILALFADIEPAAQRVEYVEYRQVLKDVMREMARRTGFSPDDADVDCLVDSLPDWPPFPDTADALRAIKSRYSIAIISNIDDDLFGLTAPRLDVEFDQVVTSQQAQSYKPSLHNFVLALDRIAVSPDRLLHVAESLFHDVAPARSMGLSVVWVNRHGGRDNGASRHAQATPDLEVPDLATLVSLMGLG
jgi:2-haloacid dehalogenase